MEQQTDSIIKYNSWGKDPYGSKGFLRCYHYRSDPTLGPGIVAL